MKSLTIATTWGTKYWPNPVKPCIESTIKNWPDHAKILFYPDDMSQKIDLPRTEYIDLCKAQPKLQEFIDRHKNNPELNPRIKQNAEEQKGFDKDAKLNVNVSQEEVNKLLKKYKKMSKYMKSPLFAVKQMDGTEDIVSKMFDDPTT